MTTCEPGVPGPHHRKIETADYEKYGPVSPSVCIYCGETRDYPNSLEYGKNDMILNIKADQQEAPASKRGEVR